MRWLKQYPITAEEVMASLESIPEVNPPGTPPHERRIGGIDDLVRRKIIEYFQQPGNMNTLLEDMK